MIRNVPRLLLRWRQTTDTTDLTSLLHDVHRSDIHVYEGVKYVSKLL